MALLDEATRREEALEEGRITLLLEQLNRKLTPTVMRGR